MSVDTKDARSEVFPEDLSFNDQESILEILIEKVLGYESAFVEYDDRDSEDSEQQTNLKVELIYTAQFNALATWNHFDFKSLKQKFSDTNSSVISGFQKLDFPPPQA